VKRLTFKVLAAPSGYLVLEKKSVVSIHEVNVCTSEEAHLTWTHVSKHELFPDRSIRFAADLFRCSGDDLGIVIDNTETAAWGLPLPP
jgi:hypothetical protein